MLLSDAFKSHFKFLSQKEVQYYENLFFMVKILSFTFLYFFMCSILKDNIFIKIFLCIFVIIVRSLFDKISSVLLK